MFRVIVFNFFDKPFNQHFIRYPSRIKLTGEIIFHLKDVIERFVKHGRRFKNLSVSQMVVIKVKVTSRTNDFSQKVAL